MGVCAGVIFLVLTVFFASASLSDELESSELEDSALVLEVLGVCFLGAGFFSASLSSLESSELLSLLELSAFTGFLVLEF